MAEILDFTMRKQNRDENISMETLTKTCTELDYENQDIVDFIPRKKNFETEDT